MLYNKIKEDLNKARKGNDRELIKDLGIIMGELARLKGTKVNGIYITATPPDDQVIKVLKGIVKMEEKTSDLTKTDVSSLHKIASLYLPQQASKEDVIAFLIEFDFSKLKNKMQAVGEVKKHFNGEVDGKMVGSIIKEMF